MAFRMQRSVPELTHLEGESEATYALYGPDVQTPGTFASNRLLARRLIERDVRCANLSSWMGSSWQLAQRSSPSVPGY